MYNTVEKIGNNEPVEPKIIEAGIALALDQVAALPSRNPPTDEARLETFRASPQSKETLAFHNISHTKSVINRFEKIVTTLKNAGIAVGSERDIQLGKLGASFHDTVQNFAESKEVEQATLPTGATNPFAGHEKIMRKRAITTNERASAEQAIAYMRKINETNQGTFTDRDEDIIRGQIDMTIPGFDAKAGTVIQPRLDENSQSSVIERALALADLGTAGMEKPEEFVSEGAALFREENLDILDAIYAAQQGTPIPEQNKEYYKHRMLGWSNFQPVFATGRKNLLDKEIGCFPEEVRQKMKEELFNNFDGAIEAATQTAEKRSAMTFEKLARDMGYDIA